MAEDKQEKDLDLDHILVIKEPEETEYSISDSSLEFDLTILEDGSLAITGGKITTPYFIQNSQLEAVKSWRYELHNVLLKKIHVDAGKNTLSYEFELADPGDFLEYTSLAAEEGDSDGEA